MTVCVVDGISDPSSSPYPMAHAWSCPFIFSHQEAEYVSLPTHSEFGHVTALADGMVGEA